MSYSYHNPAPIAMPGWQYFSKIEHEWLDARTTDDRRALVEAGYKIRDAPPPIVPEHTR